VRAARRGDGEVGEEGETTRLAEDADDVTTIGRGEAHSPEHSELDHVGSLRPGARRHVERDDPSTLS